MANQLYTATREKLLTAALGDLTSVVVKVYLMDAGTHTFSAANDFEDDLVAEIAVATVTISSAASGELDASNTTFTSVSGAQSEELITWVDTAGAASTDPLIAYYDTFSAGMPVTPNGGDITIAWPSGIVMTIKINDV